MIISPGRRYILVHIPKTGGTALALALERRVLRDDILIGDTPKARARRARVKALKSHGRLWKHSTLADIDGVLSEDEIAAMFTLTLVRNPWERVLSYWHWLRGQGFAHPAVGLAKALSFKDFLAHPQTRSSLSAWPAAAYMRTRSGVERASLYARLEHLEADLAPFWDHLGFRLAVPKANVSDRPGDWRGAYDAASRALVAEVCGEDIDRFGYRFEA